MEQTVVKANTGRALGTRNSRRLRREGQLPGVVYGLGKDPVTVDVSYVELRDALKTEAGLNTVFNLDIDGEEEMVIVRQIQRDPIRRDVTHADFLRLARGQKITLEIPLVMIGEAEAVAEAGAIVDQALQALVCDVIPSQIPDSIEVDISGLTMDHAIHVSDIVLPEGVETAVDPETLVVTSIIPRATVEDEEDEAEGEEGEEGEEGAEGSGDGEGGDAGGDAGDGDSSGD